MPDRVRASARRFWGRCASRGECPNQFSFAVLLLRSLG